MPATTPKVRLQKPVSVIFTAPVLLGPILSRSQTAAMVSNSELLNATLVLPEEWRRGRRYGGAQRPATYH